MHRGQHREGTGSIHVTDYGKTRCVYAERHEEIEPAIAREKLVKKWKRPWKFALIEAANPDWRDLWDEWFAAEQPPVQPTRTQQDQPNKDPPSPRTCLPRRRPGMRSLAFYRRLTQRTQGSGGPCQARGDGNIYSR